MKFPIKHFLAALMSSTSAEENPKIYETLLEENSLV